MKLLHQSPLPSALPAVPPRGLCRRGARKCQASGDGIDQSTGLDFPDPEAKYRRYGKHFGGRFKLDMQEWVRAAPRVRVRTTAQRQVEDLLELAVVNERLAGRLEPWEARARLEYIKRRRRNWEAIYDYVTARDVEVTLDLIEEANIQAELLLGEEAAEHMSVSHLRDQLTGLQAQVGEARERLALTQARIEANVERINMLKAEAAALERVMKRSGYSSSSSSSSTRTASSGQSASGDASSVSASAGTSTARRSAAAATLTGRTTTAAAASTSRGAPAAPPALRRRRQDRALCSSLDAEDALRDFWYPAEFSSRLTKDTLVPFELFGEPWVMFRDEDGRPACVRDECAHRACPLSLGKVVDGRVQCAYHGWEFDGDGACVKMPSTVQCRGISVSALPCMERDGFVWVWPGHGEPGEVPETTAPPSGYQVHAEICIEVPVEHGLLMENLLDLAHAPFTHTGTFARGWPVPDFVRFQAQRLLSGAWDPYPIDMAFQPPCMVISHIGLAQPGKIMRGVTAGECQRHLHQLHVCMPARRGHTRLLYRMSLDFMPWVRFVPFIDQLWKRVAGQVLGEDLVLVLGQQDRLQRGGDTWANPVSYDKLAVRYRRWRNGVASGAFPGSGGQCEAEDAVAASRASLVSMSAGELFQLDEGEGFVDQAQQQGEECVLASREQ